MRKIIAVLAFSSIFSVAEAALLPSEENTIKVFQASSPKVVYVHRIATVINRSYQKMQVPAGSGSGIIWDNKGHIVTNFHVINGAELLAVSLGNATFPARVIGVEPRKDIAVLQLTSKDALETLKTFTPFALTHSESLVVGQKTYAIGNPFGLDHSLTTGVISALGRQVPGSGGVTIHDMIQTDASINPGNSGGPLLDSSGNLIGLNTAIFSQSGSSAGVGFAVPSEEIERVVTQIINHGRVRLSGIGVQRVEPRVAARLGVAKGILVADVLPNSPAASVGLHGTYRDYLGQIHIGDIIVALNDRTVDDYDALYNLLAKIPIGEKITLTVRRDGKNIFYHMKTIDMMA